MSAQPPRVRLVASRFDGRQPVVPALCVAAGLAVFLGLQAYAADYSTVAGPILLVLFAVTAVLTLVVLGFGVFLPPAAVTVDGEGLLAKPPVGPALRIGWDAVHGFRTLPVRAELMLVFDILPAFWRQL